MSGRDAKFGLRRMRTRRAFTLVEVLIAITILAAFTAIAWTAISQMFRTEEIVSERQDRYRMVRLTMNRMADEIAMAYIAGPEHGGEEIRGEEEFHQWGGDEAAEQGRYYEPVQFGMIGRDDEVHFTSFAHLRTLAGEKASRHAQIGYFVDRHRNEQGETVYRLRRRSSTDFDDDLTRGGTVHTMIPEIEELRFQFWDPGEPELGTEEEIARGRWVSEWDTTGREHAGRLPTRVRIELTLPPAGPRGQSEAFTTQTTLGMSELLEY